MPAAANGTAEAGLARQLREEVARGLDEHARAAAGEGAPLSAAQRREHAWGLILDALDARARAALLEGRPVLDPAAEQRAAAAVYSALFGMAGFEPLLRDTRVETINANGCDSVFVRYAGGRRERAAPVAASDSELIDWVRDVAARSGTDERRFDRSEPIVSLELPDGSRLMAVMAVSRRPVVSIRRHRFTTITLDGLAGTRTLDAALRGFLTAAVRARKNIVVAGDTGIGKTTLLRALCAAVPPGQRLITIEDTRELGLDRDPASHPDVVALQSRGANVEGEGEITQADLVRATLRLSPDRVILGEDRGPETVPMINVMTQGVGGSMTSIHAFSSAGVFAKLAAYALQAPEHLPVEATAMLIGQAIHLVVHLDLDAAGNRVVSSVREVAGAEGAQVISNEVFAPGPDGRAVPAAPLRAGTLEQLAAAGFDPGLLDRPGGWWDT